MSFLESICGVKSSFFTCPSLDVRTVRRFFDSCDGILAGCLKSAWRKDYIEQPHATSWSVSCGLKEFDRQLVKHARNPFALN